MPIPFQPPPGVFPAANIMLKPADMPAFQPIRNDSFWTTWEQEFFALYPIYDGSIHDVGHIIHVWDVPWTSGDAWSIIEGYSQQNGIWVYTIVGLTLPTWFDHYNWTIGDPPPYNVHTIWKYLVNYPIGPFAGAIRWGKLWMNSWIEDITHNTDIMHWDGLAPPT